MTVKGKGSNINTRRLTAGSIRTLDHRSVTLLGAERRRLRMSLRFRLCIMMDLNALRVSYDLKLCRTAYTWPCCYVSREEGGGIGSMRCTRRSSQTRYHHLSQQIASLDASRSSKITIYTRQCFGRGSRKPLSLGPRSFPAHHSGES